MKEKSIKNGQLVGCLLMAFLSVHSISYLMNLRGGVPFSHSIWTMLLWVGMATYFLCTLKRWQQETGTVDRRHRICFAGILSLFFGVLLVAGYQLQWQGYTAPGFRGKGMLLIRGIFVGAAVLPLADALFLWLDRRREVPSDTTLRRHTGKGADSGRSWRSPLVFLGSFLGIWLCWIPVWLAYYPVIMSYDFHKQSLEALLGPRYFNSHHPLAHTWLIYVFRNLGEAVGSYETGFACFSLFQQLSVALVLGYCCAFIYRLTGKKWAVLVSALFFGCFPLVSVFVMCTTKDVLFGAFFVLFLLLFAERQFLLSQEQLSDGLLSKEPKSGKQLSKDQTYGKKRCIIDILWVLSGILMMLFRNNALYAMPVFGLFFVLLSDKKERLRALLLTVLLIAGGKGALLGLQYGFHAHSGSEIEKYSVLYQSMARVGKMQRGNLSDETYALLDTYVTAKCWEDYNPPLADTIKASVQEQNFSKKKSWDNMGNVFSAWLQIGFEYPNEYIDAFLDLTRGYWFLDDTSHAEMLGVGEKERMGLLYTYNSAAAESLPGMQHISKFPWLEKKLEKLLSENAYYGFPVVSNLFKPALWCWMLIIYLFYNLYRRERGGLLSGLYPAAYFATMLLGPTAIVRYVFPFVIAMPLLCALLFMPIENSRSVPSAVVGKRQKISK